MKSKSSILSRPSLELPFFARDALVVARALIGTYVIHGDRVARIVETEAYRGPEDAACHARSGRTKRNRSIFGPPGTAYVFLVYGMHECFNVVCNAEGSGHAVLIRAVDPGGAGPGKVTRAMGISRAHDGCILHTKDAAIWLLPRTSRPVISVTPRVGVAYAGEMANEPWRFLDAESAHVSRPPKSAIGLKETSTPKSARASSDRRPRS